MRKIIQTISDANIFKHDAAFRINQMDILSRKYNYEILDLYALWRFLDRCSFINLEKMMRKLS